MTSPATPRRIRRNVPDPIKESPGTTLEFLGDLFTDPFFKDELARAADETNSIVGRTVGANILLFSAMAARIGKVFPGSFKVQASTLSQEVANREGLSSVKGAHALMLRNDVNSRGLNGILSRKLLDNDFGNASVADLMDIVRILPQGNFRTKYKKRLRERTKPRR